MTRLKAAREIGTASPVDGNGRDGVNQHREVLFQSPLGLVEDVRCRPARLRRSPQGYSSQFQVCLPYRGIFIWHAEGEDVCSDPSQILFFSRDQRFHVSHPIGDLHAGLIITPSLALLADLLEVAPARLPYHALFRGLSRPADLPFQVLRARFLHRARTGTCDNLAVEELLVATLRCALRAEAPSRRPGSSTRRLITRTKEFIEAHLSEPFLLDDVARAVGASPAYLTDVFRRFEGLPLHKYALQARLTRALVELPHTNDLTSLALDLGFSSHSHFGAAFRGTFGTTPSAFRLSNRGLLARR